VTVVLVRHAETAHNRDRIVQPPGTPLSDRGRAQAERLATRVAGLDVRRIRTSDLARALTTAEAMRAATGAPMTVDPDLAERSFGAVRGTPYSALTVDIFGPDYVPPEGETWDAFHARVDRAWARIVTDVAAFGRVAVVTHGLVVYSLVTRHLVLPAGSTPSMRSANASVTLVEGPAPWRVTLLDCVAHLADLAPPEGAPA
jgi:broad specificity phosphatase PhoE